MQVTTFFSMEASIFRLFCWKSVPWPELCFSFSKLNRTPEQNQQKIDLFVVIASNKFFKRIKTSEPNFFRLIVARACNSDIQIVQAIHLMSVIPCFYAPTNRWFARIEYKRRSSTVIDHTETIFAHDDV